ncbi:MAG TPA: lysophospholipid acyltransferase family protein [Flavisolibacter sp.]|nr:lysophospholipid acyltransferase family protein [Flavisolibacter sp.]
MKRNDNMRMLLKPLRFLYAIYAMLVFIALMIPVFIWALAVLSLGRIRGGNLIYYGCVAWADAWFFLIGIRHRNIYEERPRAHQSYIFVSNHISYLDSAVIPKIFRHPVRPLGKVEMSRIPVFGFIYRHVIVTVDRSSPANRVRSVQLLKSVLRKEISVLVFPEGTFNETGQPLKSFYDGAFRIAIETGTPIKPVLLLDTYTRMHYKSIFSLNPGRCRAVFLPELSVEGLGPDDLPALRDRVHGAMEAALRRYGAAWIAA